MCLPTQLKSTLSKRLWSHVHKSMTNSKNRNDLHLSQFLPRPIPPIHRTLKSLRIRTSSRAIKCPLLKKLPTLMPHIENTEWVSHGMKSCTLGRLPQRLTLCRGGLQIAPLVRKKSKKDQLRASLQSKTVRKLRTTMRMMVTMMTTSLPALQMIMPLLESLAKLTNPAVQQELVTSKPPLLSNKLLRRSRPRTSIWMRSR